MKMASVLASGAGAGPFQLLSRSATPQTQIPIPDTLKLSAFKAAPMGFRFRFRLKKNVLRLPIREGWHAVSASNSNRSDGDSTQDKSGGVQSNDADAARGPPLLTILAGFLVALLVFWVIGSILMWLISLFVRLPPSK